MTATARAHLVGSLPLGSAEESFLAAAEHLGVLLRRVPDGETGKPPPWSSWTTAAYARTEGLERLAAPDRADARPTFRPVDAGPVEIARAGFGERAATSYASLARLQSEGRTPARWRLQVCLPTPLTPLTLLVEPQARGALAAAQRCSTLRELADVVSAVPPGALSIQWDAGFDLGVWHGTYETHLADPRTAVVTGLAELVDAVPEGVEVGLHLCYGNGARQHVPAGESASAAVELANAVIAAAARPVDWLHLPARGDVDPDAFLAPLRQLRTSPMTEVFVGVVGAPAAAHALRRTWPDFGVAAPCGLGGCSPAGLPVLLRLHRTLARAT